MENQVMNAILSRRSVRVFQEKQISDDELNLLLQAAVWAPSGSNSQSWRFTAVQNPRVLAEINALLRRGFLEWQPSETEYPAKLGAKKRAENESCNFFYHAPTLIIASNVPDYANAMADCSCALENLFLAAQSVGLGACWINQLTWLQENAALRAYLFTAAGIPKEHVICGAAAVGCPAGNLPKAPARREGTVQIVR